MDIYSLLFVIGFIAFLVWLIFRFAAYRQNEKDREAKWASMLTPDELKTLATDMQGVTKSGGGGMRVEIDSIDSILDDAEERKHREAVLRKRRQSQLQRSSSGTKSRVSRQGTSSGKKPYKQDEGTSRSQKRRPVDHD
jgi:hypothetical protein